MYHHLLFHKTARMFHQNVHESSFNEQESILVGCIPIRTGNPCTGGQGKGVPTQNEAGVATKGILYGEVQWIVSNGHMRLPLWIERLTDTYD